MRYSVRDNHAVFYFSGELDHAASDGIRRLIDRVITENQSVRHVIFDFSRLSFMDSSGIGVILGRYKRVVQRGGDVRICNASKAVERILAMSGIYSVVLKG